MFFRQVFIFVDKRSVSLSGSAAVFRKLTIYLESLTLSVDAKISVLEYRIPQNVLFNRGYQWEWINSFTFDNNVKWKVWSLDFKYILFCLQLYCTIVYFFCKLWNYKELTAVCLNVYNSCFRLLNKMNESFM